MSAESETSVHEGPVHPGLHAAFAALDASECSWCILRLPEDLAHPTGDIDILVGARDRSRSRKALVSAGFAPVPHDGASDLFLSYSDADELWLWIDLATELSFGDPPLHVSEEAALLTRRERVDNLWVPAPEDRLWTLLLRAALDRDGSSERYRGPLHQASASGQRPSPVRHAVEALLPSEGDASLLAMAAGADFVKTSTGKLPSAATLPVALVMLEAIRDVYEETGRMVGMKPAQRGDTGASRWRSSVPMAWASRPSPSASQNPYPFR